MRFGFGGWWGGAGWRVFRDWGLFVTTCWDCSEVSQFRGSAELGNFGDGEIKLALEPVFGEVQDAASGLAVDVKECGEVDKDGVLVWIGVGIREEGDMFEVHDAE